MSLSKCRAIPSHRLRSIFAWGASYSYDQYLCEQPSEYVPTLPEKQGDCALLFYSDNGKMAASKMICPPKFQLEWGTMR